MDEIKLNKEKESTGLVIENINPIEGVIMGDENAAKYLNLSVRTIRNWRYSKAIPFTKLGGKIFFNIETLNKMVGYDPRS
jgi:excisionase family DNA binding protein